MTIVDFLEARITDDEAAARRVRQGSHWRYEANGSQPNGSLGVVWDGVGGVAASHGSIWTGPHIARHDPARVLAECQAKRAILTEHAPATKTEHYGCEVDDGDDVICIAESDPDNTSYAAQPYPCPTVRHLAAVYADRPAYRQEWKP